jgi:hypothetical protein
MDYGIIFIIIIVIIIVIAIILIIYANRSNVTNILASFPSYRIQCVDNPTDTNNYLGLRNIPQYQASGGFLIREQIDFYVPFVYGGTNNTDPLGIWKIENLTQNNKIPITSGSEVYIVNFVYYSQTVNQTGYLAVQEGGIGLRLPIVPTADIKSASIFIYTIVGVNLFTLKSKNFNYPIIVSKTSNRLVQIDNVNVKPSVFKLDFQLQPKQQ